MNLNGESLKEIALKDESIIACRLNDKSKEALIYVNADAPVDQLLNAFLTFYAEYLKLRSDNGNTKEEV